jgi:hypothetical protein
LGLPRARRRECHQASSCGSSASIQPYEAPFPQPRPTDITCGQSRLTADRVPAGSVCRTQLIMAGMVYAPSP